MKKNNAVGILGALIGAILFSIPWIITYIYLNYILSLLAMVIAFGSFYFYKLFGGEITKKTSIVVTISSLLSITLATFVFIPLCLMLKENIAINAENISLVYQNSEFIGALVSDYLVSLLFTALGIGGIIRSINQQAYQVNGSEIKDLTSDDVQSIYEEYGALSKDKAVPNSLILGRVPYKELRRLEKEGIIVPKGTKSYFDIEAVTNKEKGKENRKKDIRNSVVIILVIILLSAILTGIVIALDNSEDNINVNDKIENMTITYQDLSLTIPNTFVKDKENEGSAVYSNNNYENDAVYQIMFDYYTTKENEDGKQLFDDYLTYLKEDFEILEENNSTSTLGGVIYLLKSIEYPNEYYYVNVNYDDKGLYAISFYTYIEDNQAKDERINELKEESNTYLSTLKYNGQVFES